MPDPAPSSALTPEPTYKVTENIGGRVVPDGLAASCAVKMAQQHGSQPDVWWYAMATELLAEIGPAIRAQALRDAERYCCKALLPEGADVIQRVTARILELREAQP